MKEDQKNLDSHRRSKRNSYDMTYKYLIAASLAALMISTFASWFFYSRWVEAEERYSGQLAEVNQLSQTYNMMKTSLDESVTNLARLRDEYSAVYQLSPVDTSKHYNVRVFWSKYSKQTYLDVIMISPPTKGHVYHLWSKKSKALAEDCGLFDYSSDDVQRMKDQSENSGWAISEEVEGVTPLQPSPVLIAKSDLW